MKPVLVKKAYLPTIDEARGVSLDDIQSLRWIPERHRKTFAQPVSVSRSKKMGLGQTVPWEIDVAQQEHGVPLPGLLHEDLESINPQRDVTGTWVGPSNIGTLLQPDFTFNPMKEAGILLGTTETPHWWRTQTQGAKSPAGEGFQYGGFPKESFVEIPRPNNATPFDIEGGAYGALTGLNEPTPEMLDFLSQFPQEQGTHRWGQTMGAPITEQQLIDQGLITPLSYEQRIVDSPFLPRKVASEPMDIAMRLLKMPLIPESIKRVSDNRAEAQFQDPITNQVYPMVAEKDPKYRTMNVGIYPNQPGQNLGAPSVLDAMDMTDKDIDEDVKEMLGLGLSNAELTETIEDNPYYESDMTWTDPEKRRRGYASALYDLVNQLGEHKVRPSDNQSYEGKQLWSKRMLPKGEPMDITFQLLKQSLELQPPMTQGVEEEQPIEEEMPMIDVSMDNYESPCECAERIRTAVISDIQEGINYLKSLPQNTPLDDYGHPSMWAFELIDANQDGIKDWEAMECEEILQWAEGHPRYADMCKNTGGISEDNQMFYASEPMDIAFQLLKERVSPEAKRHKLEYDKKYESSPERVKYREDLNRERRRRGIYGSHDHKDISHTEGGKLTLEGEHENRARHFKDKGTLRQVNKAQQTLPSYDEKMVQSLTKPDQSTMYISSRPGRETVSAEEQSAKHDELLAAIAELNKNGQMNLLTGTGKGEWGNEHSIAIQNYPPEIKQQLYELARRYGQDAVAESNAREKGMRFVNPASGEDTFSFGGREIQENPRYSTDFPTGQKISFTE